LLKQNCLLVLPSLPLPIRCLTVEIIRQTFIRFEIFYLWFFLSFGSIQALAYIKKKDHFSVSYKRFGSTGPGEGLNGLRFPWLANSRDIFISRDSHKILKLPLKTTRGSFKTIYSYRLIRTSNFFNQHIEEAFFRPFFGLQKCNGEPLPNGSVEGVFVNE